MYCILYRDPRGLINSRLHREWCKENKICIGAKYICKDLVKDYWTAKLLKSYYNNSIWYVLYSSNKILSLLLSSPNNRKWPKVFKTTKF